MWYFFDINGVSVHVTKTCWNYECHRACSDRLCSAIMTHTLHSHKFTKDWALWNVLPQEGTVDLHSIVKNSGYSPRDPVAWADKVNLIRLLPCTKRVLVWSTVQTKGIQNISLAFYSWFVYKVLVSACLWGLFNSHKFISKFVIQMRNCYFSFSLNITISLTLGVNLD